MKHSIHFLQIADHKAKWKVPLDICDSDSFRNFLCPYMNSDFYQLKFFQVHGFNSDSVLTLVSFAIELWVSCRLSVKSPVSSCVFVQRKAYKIQTANLCCCLWLLKLPCRWKSSHQIWFTYWFLNETFGKCIWYENMGMFCDTLWSLGHSLIEGWLSVPADNICSAICACVSLNCRAFSNLFKKTRTKSV